MGQQLGTGLHLLGIQGIAWADGETQPGIVFYEVLPDGMKLKASWHYPGDPRCKGGVSTGKAHRDKPEEHVAGTYTINYFYPDGTPVNPPSLTLVITRTEGARHTLSWKHDEKELFWGTGVWIEEKKVLAAAWWGKPREKLRMEVFLALSSGTRG